MKKDTLFRHLLTFAITVLLLFLISLTGCGTDTPAETTAADTAPLCALSPSVPYHNTATPLAALPEVTVLNDINELTQSITDTRICHVNNSIIESLMEKGGKMFLGTLKEYTSVIHIKNGYYYHITAMKLQVDTALYNTENNEIVTAIYEHRYKKEEDVLVTCDIIGDFGAKAVIEPHAFYVLYPIETTTLVFTDSQYPASDYADYRLYMHGSYESSDLNRVSAKVHPGIGFDIADLCESLGVDYPFGVPIDPKYQSIMDIPGAIIGYDKDALAANPASPLPPIDDFVEETKQKYSVIDGNIEDYFSVWIPDGDIFWHIATFSLSSTVQVGKHIEHPCKLAVATQYRYENGSYVPVDPQVPDLGLRAKEISRGLFVLARAKAKDGWIINGTRYKVLDYADWILVNCFISGGDEFIYHEDLENYPEGNKYPCDIFR